MHPEAAAAYYANKFGSAQAALDALAGSWVDAEDREVRQLLQTAAYKAKVAEAEASRLAVVAKTSLTLNMSCAA